MREGEGSAQCFYSMNKRDNTKLDKMDTNFKNGIMWVQLELVAQNSRLEATVYMR